MKRILINATHNEEIRVALCKGNHMYDFDLENRTREQKKANIYKAHVTRVEPSLEAVFVEYGAERQGFLPIREIAKEYLAGNPRTENVRDLIKEGDTLIVQVEKEERGNKGAALSTFISLAGRYLVLMPNNPRGGGISRQISGKQREEMKRIVSNLQMPKGMSVIIRTAGIGKSQEDLQHDLDHLLNIWKAIGEQDSKYPSPRLVHQEAGVVTRALRDYMRDDIAEIWIDSANAYDEAVYFIKSVMPKQIDKLRKYTDPEPMFARFGIEKQIETAYQREVRLPSGGSIVIDQTEAMVAIDINSAKSTKGSDVAETAYHTNLEAAEEIARQLRLRDMGGLVVIDFIDMYDSKHQKDVEKRLVDSTKQDRARVQFGEISKFGLMEMSRQRLRPSLEESTGYKCPRCHGNGMIRDLRSLGLSIMRQIEQVALTHRQGEVQAEVPTDLAAFLLNEKRDSLVYLEQDSGTRITILPHAHMVSPDHKLHYNPEGFAPSSYERISDSEDEKTSERGYEVNWQTADNERPEHQPKRQPRGNVNNKQSQSKNDRNDRGDRNDRKSGKDTRNQSRNQSRENHQQPQGEHQPQRQEKQAQQPQAVAWLSNLFAPTPQAKTEQSISSQEAAQAIETIVNNGGQSLGSFGQVDASALVSVSQPQQPENFADSENNDADENNGYQNKRRKPKHEKGRDKKDRRNNKRHKKSDRSDYRTERDDRAERSDRNEGQQSDKPKREPNSRRDSRGEYPRGETLTLDAQADVQQATEQAQAEQAQTEQAQQKQERSELSERQENRNDNRNNRRNDRRNDKGRNDRNRQERSNKPQQKKVKKASNADEVSLQVSPVEPKQAEQEVVHLSLDRSKPVANSPKAKKVVEKQTDSAEKPVEKTSGKASETVAEAQPEQAGKAETVAKDETVVATEQTAVMPVSLRADGRANNDPRVVRAELAKKLTEQLEQAVSPVASSAKMPAVQSVTIAGSVGEFLRVTLDNAEERIAQEGVIACFIEAVAQAKACGATDAGSASSEDNKAHANSVNEAQTQVDKELAEFDFSNYGYDSLSADYLSEFNTMTASVAQFATVQGKTETTPTAIGKRAGNDPRGQHPDYIEAEVDIELNVEAEMAEETPATAVVTETVETEKVETDLAELQEVSEVAESAEAEVVASEEGQKAEAGQSDSQADEFANAFGRMLDEEKVEEAGESQVESTPASSEQADDKDKSAGSEERTKTTFDKYKSMLANVSEQLSGQTGTNSLFLSTPTVPKSRSRKKDSE